MQKNLRLFQNARFLAEILVTHEDDLYSFRVPQGFDSDAKHYVVFSDGSKKRLSIFDFTSAQGGTMKVSLEDM